jgi:hypothetical protein
MKQVTVRKLCETCKAAEIKATGIATSNTWGMQWQHQCTGHGCSAIHFYQTCYPEVYTEFEENEKREEWV